MAGAGWGFTAALAAATAPPGAAATGSLALHECRLQHPLRLASIQARCGVLEVPEDRSVPGGAGIELSVAVVPSLKARRYSCWPAAQARVPRPCTRASPARSRE
jgi:hypothetical protein